MPYKDKEKKLAAQRRHYAAHREEVIAKVLQRRRTDYAGTCLNCGGPTVGQSKNDRPEYCGKSECKSVQRRRNWGKFWEVVEQ